MTDKQQPEALRQAAWLKREGASCQRHYDLGVLIERQYAELETLRARVQELEAHLILDCMTHVQKPSEIEHVAGDVSKNGAELSMSAQQPAPAAQPAPQQEALRLAKYVARRKLAKQLDTNEIHGFDSGCDTEAVLLLSDIEAVLSQVAALTAAQPAAPQQEAQEPVAWYVTGCGRLLDEDEAKAEARHIGGTARAIPVYTAPQPSPAAQGDALDAARYRWLRENWSTMGSTYHDDKMQLYVGRPKYTNITPVDIDVAIDAARAAQEGKSHDN